VGGCHVFTIIKQETLKKINSDRAATQMPSVQGAPWVRGRPTPPSGWATLISRASRVMAGGRRRGPPAQFPKVGRATRVRAAHVATGSGVARQAASEPKDACPRCPAWRFFMNEPRTLIRQGVGSRTKEDRIVRSEDGRSGRAKGALRGGGIAQATEGVLHAGGLVGHAFHSRKATGEREVGDGGGGKTWVGAAECRSTHLCG